ncbi:MAG: phosphoribosylformylglycinamidine cyclo-ligase [Christensenellales bacterium]|jgi:phosphoribosylformylglycinamidine cyclo-ligase
MSEKPLDYKDAGVDVQAGYRAVELMKKHTASTLNERVIGGLGGFSGLYSMAGLGMEEPVLVAGADGVGTKLKLAFAMDKHDTVGIDCVAMCVNDIVCQGARPLFFLDYIATGKLDPHQAERIVAGVAEGCRQAGCALIGGETAEMPGFYPENEYDLAGFAVGVVDKKNIIDGSAVTAGDALVGLFSSGVHSNGYSLVRKLLGEDSSSMRRYSAELGTSFGEALLAPTRIYVKVVLELIQKYDIHGLSHITGGGFIENIPRMLQSGQGADIDLSAWEVPPVFRLLQRLANMPDEAAFNTFNMGIGMVAAVPQDQADAVVATCREMGQEAAVVGRVVRGEREVRFK